MLLWNLVDAGYEGPAVTDISRYGGARIFVISQFNENRRCTLCLKLPSDRTYNRPRRSQTFSNLAPSSNRSRINTVRGWKPI